MPLRPWVSSSQYCSGLFTPPGNRHPIPITAIGSVLACSAVCSRAVRSSILCSASAMMVRLGSCVGCSCWLGQPFAELLQQFVSGGPGVGVGAGLVGTVGGVGGFGEQGGQVCGEAVHGGVVEDDGGAEWLAEDGAEVALQGHAHQRIHPELEESGRQVELGGGQPHDR